VRIVTTGWRRGSDDAIGAEMLPQLRGTVGAGIERFVPLRSGGVSFARVCHTHARLAHISIG